MKILAVNPPIIDFAAYDFWLKPYGFLVLLTYLKKQGFEIDFVDCLEKKTKIDKFGRGRFFSQPFPKPTVVKNIPRRFKHYGLSIQELEERLKNTKPQIAFITSSMTYWYLAVKETVHLVRKLHPYSKIAVGGNYINLCLRHAQNNIPADFYVENDKLGKFLMGLGAKFEELEFFSTLPQYEFFYPRLSYVVLRTSWGCPFRCSFCASHILFKEFFRIKSKTIVDFITYYYRRGIVDFVFYDDALLYPPSEAENLLRLINKKNLKVRFHTPNALHMKFLNLDIARLLKKCNFINPHFGLETLNKRYQQEWGNKVNSHDLGKTIKLMHKAGFKPGEFSVYLLLGYPGQNILGLKKEVEFLSRQGIKVSLAEFSPVPQTKMFKEHPLPFPDPLWHNNSLFGFYRKEEWPAIFELKNYVRLLNQKYNSNY